MIILPDRRLSGGRILLATPRHEWMPPSHAQQKTFFGHEDRTRFRLRARTHDGHIVWQGWFDDRDDADAFLFAMASGTLRWERALWDYPVPAWRPDFEGLLYEFATQTILTTTGSVQTYSKPTDWNNGDNRIDCIGGGASGGTAARASSTGCAASGGAGGGYGYQTNLTLSGDVSYNVGSGGSAASRTGAGTISGNAGSDSWFNGGTYAAASVGGLGGGAGTGATGTGASVSASTANSGKGTGSASGGAGGSASVATSSKAATGGGGAGGPNGAGNASTSISGAASVTTTGGGSGDAGSGGGGGSGNSGGNGSAGSAGTEWTTAGSGGGGGAGNRDNTSTEAVGGSGGNYGGGGGGVTGGGATTAPPTRSGAGIQGVIVVTYTPGAAFSLANANIAMMGM